ncbi:hypothetical protein [Streptomyces nigrescens]|uniref:SpdB2 protein n=1 Tax=Streptomyces nigrescens TaxID=1920 RepID=A0A640T8I3_STRNI|nr:hypothetical protein [Streptomyces libani]WAT94908.1 hypothetical protein STRLI_000580 [Streptomyces libani subsp. libani]GFE20057.1 hypothetical protein Sliba_05100 [Streptomyces libani subsp. libani]GGV85700.1 hypothetical protein GCM10010500_02630 [Streptomyces libani subsp. libani]
MATAIKQVNGAAVAPDEPRFDPVALAEAEAIRTEAAGKADALRVEAEGKAKAAEILAEQEAEKQRLANERAAMKLERERAAHDAYLAEKAEKEAKAKAAAEKAAKAADDEAEQQAQRDAEQRRSENTWKWGARSIYGVGLVIAAPIQFLAFWDDERPFLVAAPALLEGLALVLAFGAAWAVAHRRDVMPYRVGIMIGALVAAGINLWHGISDDSIGVNAGLIGALASLGGPIVLMAYEHGIAQKADGIPSWREQRAADRKAKEDAAERERAKQEKADAETRAAEQKADQQLRADVEQTRKDEDRRKHHKDVWEVAEALRSARGSQYVTEQIWADAWYRVTGSKVVGVRPEMEAESKAAQARMKAIAELPVLGDLSQVGSQKAPRAKKDPDAPDGRRFNGGVPPLRRAGDAQPYCDAAKKQAALEQAHTVAANKTI